ncbi:hypothetical protein [Hyphomicrobium sp. D-2]|uniref:hypothetical protein n=1 Tax=Hyphomicrobium sp. D-2 TaxID=3041621 RepID=UPI00245452DF|nr:hypothetical protein [Hyphomicrobium sp. D-2]MDH4983728.1 hypothetical protein [Hyphomicrobium sp. D-2]
MDFSQAVDAVMANPAGYARYVLIAVLVIAATVAMFKVGPRLWRVIEDVFFTNWQLAMLGSAAIALSLAGGWTTWDGMTNFTGEPVLSLMFTFGIHCVMLISAWLIGETFATGMNTVARSGLARVTAPLIVILILGAALLIAGIAVYQYNYGLDTGYVINTLLAGGAVLCVLGLIVVFAHTDVVAPYAQALRIMAKNSMLWVMFLATMATSVFFSFDSRFNVVFPQDQRERVSELRATNQVSAIIADIGATIANEEQVQTSSLFQSEGWHKYEDQLDRLASIAQDSSGEIERYFNDQIETRNRSIMEQQERIATAQSGQAGLSSKKTSITDELARLESDRSTLAADHSAAKTELDTRAKAIDAKRVEAMAESKGVEGTLKEGRGPVYRQLMGDLSRMQAAYKIQDDRVKDAKKRLDTADTRIAQIKRELASIDGELAKYKGEQETASQRIDMMQTDTGSEDATPRVDPGRVLPAFETARAEFRQSPAAERLALVQQRCTQLYSAMYAADVTKQKVAGIDCDPKQASEAAAALFTLQAGVKTFNANCVGGDKLASQRSTDALFGFAVKCLSDSGLPSQKTDELRGTIAFAEMNRDDRAHRFVVSWNAFQDGNRLAYLALAIAIGIDSLIFMTGLFGANAVRSPLADVPTSKGRNSQQLEAIIENALLPDTFDNARAALDAMQPITNADGYMAEVRPEMLEPHTRHQVMNVLNAGATISAVAVDAATNRYLVRSELFEFLSIVAKRSFEANRDNVDLAELEKIVGVALLPDLNRNAEIVLSYLQPIDPEKGFTAEINLAEVLDEDRRIVRSTLNAGATLGRVQRAGKDTGYYYIHRDLYKTLARIRARTLSVNVAQPRLAPTDTPAAIAQHGQHFGGSLTEPARAIEHMLPEDEFSPTEIREGFVTRLLTAMRIEPAAWNRTPGNALVTAIAANEAFVRARRINTALDSAMRQREDEARTSFDEAYTLMKSKLQGPHASWDRQMLDDAYHDLAQSWPVLMMLPNGPFETVLRDLVEDLEADAGDGRLTGEQQALFDITRTMLQAFRANNRTNETSWRHLQLFLEDLPHAEARISSDDGRTLMN